MQRRSTLLILTFPVLVFAGCATTTYAIVPQGSSVARRAGLSLVAEGDEWRGEPYDLPNVITPILVEIENHTDKDIRISYSDFSLTGDQGFRYPAMNPYKTSPRVGENEQGSTEDHGGILTLAAYKRGRGRTYRARPRHRRYHRRFFIRPRARSYFYYYEPWPYPIVVPPFYGDHVVLWSETPIARPSEDVLRLGLPEGVVKPGGQISGFLYFQNAGQHTDHLLLSWTAYTPDGKKVAALDVPFNVILHS